MKIFNALINALYPQKCIACGQIIDSNEQLCEYCFEKLEYIDFSKTCLKCGVDKKRCECKYRVFHFKSAVAPFKNDGIAKTAMYRYKFKRTPGAELFFGREMAKTVRSVYYDISFDGVTFVPMHPRRQMKRGFNQAEQFARVLADIMGLKLYDKLLSAKYSKVTQHSSSLKERFANVKDAYTFNHKVTGKTILLVDDIKTSGASLDACAKQLLLAGAENVYCITGLVTDKERKKVDGN